MINPLFISRDGVINTRREGGITHRDELELIDGSIDTIVALSKKGFTIILVTHQPGLSQGVLALDELEAIHAKIIDRVENRGGEIASVFYCAHDESDHCYCRPPATGLLDVIEIELDCDVQEAYYFCDNQAEASAALQKRCQVIMCDTENTLQQLVAEHKI
jgi:D-glycero-D-manno-heptose 1,7-bisphosphate phosphatase